MGIDLELGVGMHEEQFFLEDCNPLENWRENDCTHEQDQGH